MRNYLKFIASVFIVMIVIFSCSKEKGSKVEKENVSEERGRPLKEEEVLKLSEDQEKEVGYITNEHLDMGGGEYMEVWMFENYGKKGKVIAKLKHGVKIDIVGRVEDELEIETEDGDRGWVSKWAVVERKPKRLK